MKHMVDAIGAKILDKEPQIKLVIAALLAGGHVLLEDRPGLGKTTLAAALAQTFGMDYTRVQLTSDMMPSDVLGVSIYDGKEQSFTYHKGPIFTQFLLADELNRATPKTQSALLEAMAENQVSMDGTTYDLEEVFFVMATQNPMDDAGTYHLPHSQLDRFIISLSLGYPSRESERALYSQAYLKGLYEPLKPLADVSQLKKWQQQVSEVHASEEVLDHLQQLIAQTRQHPDLAHGLSPRAGLSFFKLSQAMAFMAGRDFLIPEDVADAFYPVCRHRLVSSQGFDVVKKIIHQIAADTPFT
ncbi:AAA family ATPase [Marinicella rhabdoformis]|uniref:AAA family ATPase n=1 Tax=Marinicella rhabdoformis TaxID=2580566 RepID=UPI0012AEDE02|nr:MoxR family ATPase [Marinicella rhabdoformis]